MYNYLISVNLTTTSYDEGFAAGYNAGWRYVARSSNPHIKGQAYHDGYCEGYRQGRDNYGRYLMGQYKPKDATTGL